MPRNRNPPIRVGCRVSGRHGELETPPPSGDNDNPKKRKRRRKKLLYGQVVYSVGPNSYRVLWDDGGYTDCKSTTLKYEGEGTPLMERIGGRSRVLDSSNDPVPCFEGNGLQAASLSNNDAASNTLPSQASPTCHSLRQPLSTQPPEQQNDQRAQSNGPTSSDTATTSIVDAPLNGASIATSSSIPLAQSTGLTTSINDAASSAGEQSTDHTLSICTTAPSIATSPSINPSPLIRNVLESGTDTTTSNVNNIQSIANASNHDSNESFDTAASSNRNVSGEAVLESNAEDVSIPNEGVIEMEDELEHENDFIYEDTADREQQQGEFWEYQRVIAKDTIKRYVEERKSVTIGNRQVRKTWTHVAGIEGEEPVDYKNIGVVGFNFNYRNKSIEDQKKKRINFLKLVSHLWPGDWRKNLSKLNDEIAKENEMKVRNNVCFIIYFKPIDLIH